jgi:leucyl-tRNA synthetase
LNNEQLTDTQKQFRYAIHSTLDKVGDDYGRRQTFNTAIAAVMGLVNDTYRFVDQCESELDNSLVTEALNTIVLMLNPVVPHICHVLWQRLGHRQTVVDASWPEVDKTALAQSSVLIVLQVNGKLRAKVEVSKDIDRDTLEALALGHETIQRYVREGELRKVIVVPGKLVNVVVA